MIFKKKLKKLFAVLLFFYFFGFVGAQNDSIYIAAKLSQNHRILDVRQELIYHNKTKNPISEIKLQNWISAYKNRETDLYKRKIDDRSSELHFSNPEELGKLNTLEVKINGIISEKSTNLNKENLYFALPNALASGESIKIELEYQLQLPISNFTGYGFSKKNIAIKYFFLVPDSFEDQKPSEKKYIDTEETANHSTFWTINLDIPANYYSKSNLPEIQSNYYKGFLKNDPEILISQINYPKIITDVMGKRVEVSFGYMLTDEERQHLEFYLPLHLIFINEKLGMLPDKLFISEKFKKKEDFFGNDDITFWKFRFPLFSTAENYDLDYFSIVSKKIIEQHFITYKENDHWFKDGIKTYLEQEYLKKNYGQKKLLGMLTEASIIGIKPLKIFNASRLNLIERYGIAYQYMMTQNLDQKIDEDFSKLSNFNEMSISNFETGNLLSFVSEKMGTQNFDSFLKNYFSIHENEKINTQNFLDQLAQSSNNDSEFLASMIARKHRVNFKIKKFKRENNQLLVKIAKNTTDAVPFKLETITKEGIKNSYWFSTPNHSSNEYYAIPESDAHKIVINSGHLFPESNFRDNYIYTQGFFSNTKKIKFKLLKDIPNPEYNEIYINPRLKFNAYDKFLVGLNFRNESLLDTKFSYSITPYYSTGTGKMTGSGGISYSFMPPESFFRSLNFGISGSYFHYDYDLSYRKYTAYSSINFAKEPRSAIGQSIGVSYEYYQKDLNLEMILNNEYERYNLWNLSYGYSDNKLIHEKSFGTYIQGMEDFKKIAAEAFYRYEYAPNKKIAFRLFAGYFLTNKTKDDIFDFGISRVSNYSFSYGLIGQSATSGFLSQQFILADGGFKSFIGTTANQWITSFNVDAHVWKLFNIYADAGAYKNKNLPSKFIWDSGVKLRLIPDFFEVYLPVYSTLGFEPAQKNYFQNIRFTLVLNLGAVVNTARRGWY